MTPDIEALFRKARKSLEAARILIKDSYFDFAASRAYYAMFYVAEALLADIDNHSTNTLPSLLHSVGNLQKPGSWMRSIIVG
jgi:uncharacterized protein (UPF0332 family)